MTTPLRSRNWFGPKTLDGLMNRGYLKAEGFSDLVFDGRPVIGIANSWSELNNCNAHLRQLAEAVKRGVWSAGGFPLEFPVMSLGEILMRPTTMLFRNLMAMEVEEQIRAYPLDAVVLLSGCDKTTPAMLMGAASADVPAIMVTGGPMLRGMWRDREIGSGTDARKIWAERRADNISDEEIAEVESCLSRSAGHCMVMGTASTMAAMAETLGITLPGNAAIPASDSRRLVLSEMSGRRAVEMALERGPRPLRALHRGGLRQCDPRRHGDRRQHQCHRPPHRHRRAHRRPAAALPLRRAVALDAAPRQRAAVGQVPDGGLLLRGRPARRPPRAASPAPRRRPHGERQDAGRKRRATRPATTPTSSGRSRCRWRPRAAPSSSSAISAPAAPCSSSRRPPSIS